MTLAEKRKKLLLLASAFLLLCVVWSPQTAGQEQNSCLVCHSEIRADYIESVHATSGVACTDCHGGDPTTLNYNAAHALEAFYRDTPKKTEIPLLCAACHADPVKMKPYGLRTDQFAEYQTSQHGKLLATGDTNVAVCTDCHTSHRILSPSEPRSTVHANNIPTTCARCHSDRALMEPYGISVDQFASYQSGAHGVALLEEGNMKAPNCATCHGIHGATPPGVEDVSKICGTCHINERISLNVGPHKKLMDEQRISECASCHSNHKIESTERKLFDTACLNCHTLDSKEYSSGQKIKTLLLGAQGALQEAESALKQVQGMAFDVSAHGSRLVEAWASLTQVLPVQHSLDITQVEELTRRAHSIANDIRGEIHSLQTTISIRWLGLALVWAYILLTLVVVYLYRSERDKALEKEQP